MTKLSASEASRDLGGLLARALSGEEIGIECDGRVVALHPVDDFQNALAEYGLNAGEADRAFNSLSEAVEEERKAGKLRKLT